jgi:hypothetical protein
MSVELCVKAGPRWMQHPTSTDFAPMLLVSQDIAVPLKHHFSNLLNHGISTIGGLHASPLGSGNIVD